MSPPPVLTSRNPEDEPIAISPPPVLIVPPPDTASRLTEPPAFDRLMPPYDRASPIIAVAPAPTVVVRSRAWRVPMPLERMVGSLPDDTLTLPLTFSLTASPPPVDTRPSR